MMAVCERPLEPPLRPRPTRRRAERLVARPVPAQPSPVRHSRLALLAALSALAHVVVLAALGTIQLVSASVEPPPPPVALAGTVRILTEDERAGEQDGASEVAESDPVATLTGPRLVAMNRAAPPMPEVPSPFSSVGPVIAAPAELAPSGVGFVIGRASVTETKPAASAGGHGGDGAGAPGAGGGVGIALLYAPRPVYPAAARTAGIEGATVLRMEIQPDGSVGAVQVVESSGFDILDEAAVAAVRKWKFVPWKVEGRPVAAYVEQAISFRLNRS